MGPLSLPLSLLGHISLFFHCRDQTLDKKQLKGGSLYFGSQFKGTWSTMVGKTPWPDSAQEKTQAGQKCYETHTKGPTTFTKCPLPKYSTTFQYSECHQLRDKYQTQKPMRDLSHLKHTQVARETTCSISCLPMRKTSSQAPKQRTNQLCDTTSKTQSQIASLHQLS